MFGKKEQTIVSVMSAEKERLIREIREAEKECAVARSRFDEALEFEQVDYAVYSLEAAEKKLDILLRKAKLVWGQMAGGREEGRERA